MRSVVRSIIAFAALAAPVSARESASTTLAFVGSSPAVVLGHAMALRGGMRTAPVAPLSMKAGGSDLESMCKQKISSNKAMIFSKSSCPFCLKAKKAMDEVGIKYEVMELDKTPDGPAIQDIMLSMTGGRSVPRVFINGKFIGGGDDTAAKAKSGELIKLYKA